MRVAIIPARGGSRRIPGKNIREFHGRPIIGYPLEKIRLSESFDYTVVSSDDHRTRILARQHGVRAVDRELRYAQDDVGTQEVVRDALVEMEVAGYTPPEFVCCVYATTPLLRSWDLLAGYAVMRAENKYAYVAGWYYWGRAEWFGDKPLTEGIDLTATIGDRWIDINTEDDWKRAEEMYAALHKVAA